MRNSYGYESYRGRSKLQTALTAVAVILFVVLLLAVAFFFFAQQYIVYDDQGKAHLEFPFLQQAEATPTPAQPSEPAIVVVTETPQPTPTPTPEPIPAVVELPLSALTDGTAAQQVASAGGNAALFVMKGEDGALAWVSEQEMALGAGMNAAQEGINEAIAALNGGELYTVAKISLFKDLNTPYHYSEGNALRSQSGNWRAPGGCRWFSPASPAVRDYLTNICRELCELGFDEILLDNCAFPAEGHLEWIVEGELYDPNRLTQDLEDFCAQLREDLSDYPQVRISMTVSPAVLTLTEGDRSGQTPELFSKYADRVYLPQPGEGEDWSEALARMGFQEKDLIYPAGTGPEGAGSYR